MIFSVLSEAVYVIRLILGSYILAGSFLVKRKYFVLRLLSLIPVLALAVGYVFFSGWFYQLNSPIEVVYLVAGLYYVMLSVLVGMSIVLCFDGRRNEYIYVMAVSAMVESIVYALYMLLVNLGLSDNFGYTDENKSDWQGLALYYFIILLFYCVFFMFILLERKNSKTVLVVEQKTRLTVVLACMLVLYFVVKFVIQYMHYSVKELEVGDYNILPVILNCFLIMFSIASLYFLSKMVRYEEMSENIYVLNALMQEKEKQFDQLRSNIQIINSRCHDLKRLVRSFRYANETDRNATLDEIENMVNIYEAFAKTGNAVADAVISDKGLVCQAHNIQFSYMVDGKCLSFVRTTDLYIVLDNILSNAVEAVERMEPGKVRYIDLAIKQNRGNVAIQCRNSYEGADICDIPDTVKQDRLAHGFGIKSIKYIIERYGGTMVISGKEGVFTINIIIPIEE